MRSVRPVVRTLIAVLLAGCCAMIAATPAQASAQHSQRRSGGTSPADSHALTLSIDSVSPQSATATSTVTLSGTLSNLTGSAIPDMAVQLQSYPSAFATRSDMASYTGGGPITLQFGTVILQPVGTADQLHGSLAAGATTHWTVSFNPAQDFRELGVSPGFGVYPLQVAATSAASSHTAAARTLLPYWPGSREVKPLQVAWIWPLIDTPQQGACPQDLSTSSLAGSLAAGGRLATLLGTGAQWAARDDLTWAIDPALLSDVSVMTRPYFTGGNSACTERTAHDTRSAAATSWLSELRADTAGAAAFATPYADVDASALSHAGLDASLRSAYQVGDAVAGEILPDTFGGTSDSGEDGSALAAAWPAGGTADAGVLTSLASDGGIKTVVLGSDEVATSAPDYDNALARAQAGNGTSMSVLLADSGITGILGAASARSPVAAQFAATQDFLAQTAMILAEAPDISRSLVIAPPAGWDPSAAEAADLLRLTKATPWLHATGLGTLAARTATAAIRKLPVRQVSKAELSGDYISQLKALTANLEEFKDLLSKPSPAYLSALYAAAAATESAAWRGKGSYGGWLALIKLSDFLTTQQGEVKVIASRKVLLAGTTGTTPVSVTNGLSMPVEVVVEAFTPAGSPLRVGSGSFEHLLTVDAHMTQTVRLPMSWSSSSIGTTTLRIQLFTSNGVPLTTRASSASMSVEITRFGRTLLAIIAGALGVLVLTAIVRLRRKRRAAGQHGGGASDRAKDQAENSAHAGGAG
jgi:hypothetical protein